MASDVAVLALLRAYRPELSTDNEKLAFAVHCVLLAEGFELLEAGPQTQASSASPVPAGQDLLSTWRDSPGEYLFLYSLPTSTSTAQSGAKAGDTAAVARARVQCLAVGDMLMMDACRLGSVTGGAYKAQQGAVSEVYHAELEISNYVASTDSSDPAPAPRSYGNMYKNLGELVGVVRSQVALPLLLGTQRGTSQGPASTASEATVASAEQGEVRTGANRQLQEPHGDRIFDDVGVHMVEPPYSSTQAPSPALVYPPIPDMPTFGDDLGPGGAAGLGPVRVGPGLPGSGMLVGPEDPRWGRVRPGFADAGPDFLGPSFPRRPSNVPPGARFDPFGPPGVPGFEPGHFGDGNGRRPPGGFHGDLQFFP